MFIDPNTNEAKKDLRWIAPTENTDGTPIDYDLAYNLYADGQPIASFPGTLNPEGQYTFPLADVGAMQDPGDYNLTLTAFDTALPDRESEPSNGIVIRRVAGPFAPAAFSAV